MQLAAAACPLVRRPCILIGSAFGALLALLLREALPPALDLQPGVYALVGATAMLGAVFRSSISLVVIVVEGTRGIGAWQYRAGVLRCGAVLCNALLHC